MKTSHVMLTVGAIACVVVGLVVMSRSTSPDRGLPTAMTAPAAEPAPIVEPPSAAAPPEAATTTVAEPAAPAPSGSAPPLAEPAPAGVKAQQAKNPAPGGGKVKEPLRDPLAREALALVGLDPSAEAYWEAAINDESLSGHERSDLIEDLNEDGLSDPKHPAPEDLPVILRRIRIIETAGPDAMDRVNADAFQEAYNDLINLANLALGGGEPVR